MGPQKNYCFQEILPKRGHIVLSTSSPFGLVMRNGFSPVLLAAVLCLSAGCSHFPQLQEIPLLGPQKMQTTQQWKVLANTVANRINNELIRQHYLDASVYVRHSCEASNSCGPGGMSPFDEGFNDLLTSQLTAFGISTLKAPEGAGLVVDYKAQLVYHGHYEVLITTSIVDRNTFVVRSSDIFPLNSEDFWKYRQATPAPEIELTNRDGAPHTSKPKASAL